jgi:hypothetical protein
VDESCDEQFEVLDVGGRRRDRGRAEPDLPTIQLGDESPEPRDEPHEPGGNRPPTWRQAGVVLGAMVLAVVATTLVLDARDEAVQSAAAAETVDLIAGEIQDLHGFDPGQTTVRLNVTVYNAGPRDVDILSIHPIGWSTPADEGPAARTLTVGEWTGISMPVVPSCDGPTPPTLEAEVRTEAGERVVTLERSRSRDGYSPSLEWIRDEFCGPAFERERVWMWVTDIELLTADSDGLPMRLLIQAEPVDGVVITEVMTGTPGLDVESVDLPATLSNDLGSSGVDVVWSVTDCDEATTFDDADVRFQVDGKGPVGSDPLLPTAAVVALARYALTVCDE